MSGRDGEAVEALSVSPARSMSPENGLQRTSLELLPFTTAFFATQLGWPERPFLLIRKVRASVKPSVGASNSLRHTLRGLRRKEYYLLPLVRPTKPASAWA